jgi:hypothetical protein
VRENGQEREMSVRVPCVPPTIALVDKRVQAHPDGQIANKKLAIPLQISDLRRTFLALYLEYI